MPIYGTKYQTFRWEGIKKILTQAAMLTLGSPEQPQTFLNDLMQHKNDFEKCVPEWRRDFQYSLGVISRNPYEYGINPEDEASKEDISLAIEMSMIIDIQPAHVGKYLALIQKETNKENDLKQWTIHCRKLANDLFSELRYIKDAENITISTGKQTTTQHVRVLAKVEELNRAVEKIFADGDLVTLAKITGSDFQELQTNPFLVNRHQHRQQRAELIIAADRVLRTAIGKSPQLPTNKFNNLKNPEKIELLLQQLETPVMQSTSGFDKSEGNEYDWLERLAGVCNEAVPDHEYDTNNNIESPEDFSHSPDINTANAHPDQIRDQHETCFAQIDQVIQLGLMIEMDTSNDIIGLLTPEHLKVLNGKKLSKAALAKLAGKTIHHFNKAVEQAKQDYLECMSPCIPV